MDDLLVALQGVLRTFELFERASQMIERCTARVSRRLRRGQALEQRDSLLPVCVSRSILEDEGLLKFCAWHLVAFGKLVDDALIGADGLLLALHFAIAFAKTEKNSLPVGRIGLFGQGEILFRCQIIHVPA